MSDLDFRDQVPYSARDRARQSGPGDSPGLSWLITFSATLVAHVVFAVLAYFAIRAYIRDQAEQFFKGFGEPKPAQIRR